MGLFGNIIKAAVKVAVAPIQIVAATVEKTVEITKDAIDTLTE